MLQRFRTRRARYIAGQVLLFVASVLMLLVFIGLAMLCAA